MRSALERLLSKLRSALTPNQSVSNAARISEVLRDWQLTLACLDKSDCKKNNHLVPFGLDDTSIYHFKSDTDDSKKDEWVSTAQTPCLTSSAGGSDGTTPEKLKLGKKNQRIGCDLFKMFVEQDGKMSVHKFIKGFQKNGIRLTDPRLKPLVDGLKLNLQSGIPHTPLRVSCAEFIEHLNLSSHALLSKAFRDNLAVKDFPAFCKIVEETYEKCKDNHSGKVATYIPQLAATPRCNFGVSVCTIDGQRFSIGDVNTPFTIQSMSKPLTYALCLEYLGANVVHEFVGQEPSGRIFNELVLDNNNKPHNPMVNAGAIVICSLLLDLVQPHTVLAEKYDMVSAFIKRLAGGERIGFNNAVFLSEREAADRNYAIAFLLRENRCFPPTVDLRHVMDFYFQCCSIDGDCEALAVIGATLANGGLCPLTEERILRSESVRDTLSLMHSCGMYDYSGQFAFKVGIPAKSGVSGGIFAIIPDLLGLCCWSPALDSFGNSARGLQFCEEFVSRMNFHPYGIWGSEHNHHILGLKYNKILNAAFVGDMATLNRFLEAGENCHERDRDGRTPLHIAAAEGHYDCVQLLLKYGESACCQKDKWGRLPLDEARHFGNEEILKLLEPITAKCKGKSPLRDG